MRNEDKQEQRSSNFLRREWHPKRKDKSLASLGLVCQNGRESWVRKRKSKMVLNIFLFLSLWSSLESPDLTFTFTFCPLNRKDRKKERRKSLERIWRWNPRIKGMIKEKALVFLCSLLSGTQFLKLSFPSIPSCYSHFISLKVFLATAILDMSFPIFLLSLQRQN